MQKELLRRLLRKPLIKNGIILILMSMVILGVYKLCVWPELEFSPKAWKEAKEGTRYLYCKDLISKNILKGLTIKQVEKMLGYPDSPDDSYNTYYFIKSNIPIGAYYLKVCFIADKNEKIAYNYSIVTD